MKFIEFYNNRIKIDEMWNSKGKSEPGKSQFANPPSAVRPKPRDVEPKPSTSKLPKPRDGVKCGVGGGMGRC